MKKQFLLASSLLFAVLCTNAQQTGTGNRQDSTRNTKSTKKAAKSTNTNQQGNTQGGATGNGAGTTGTGAGTTGSGAGTAGAGTGTGGIGGAGSSGTGETATIGDTTGQMTSTGRYAAMGIQMGSLHRKDMKFVMEANSSNIMELQLSQMALQRAVNPAVKEFAQMMVQHHSMAAQEMKQMLSAKGALIPDSALLPQHRMRMELMQNMQGADFDRAYMRIMVDAHEEDLDEFEDVLDDARDADVKAFANRMLPTLRTHYAHAKETRKRV